MSIETIERLKDDAFFSSVEPEVTQEECLAAIEDNDKSAVGYYLLAKIRIRQGRF